MTLSMTQMEEARRALSTPLFADVAGDMDVSFEFFPPKTAKMEEQLWEAVATLEPLAPRFVSVTYGAGGTTRERTHQTVARIQRETSLAAAAHLTCVEATRARGRSGGAGILGGGRAPHRCVARRQPQRRRVRDAPRRV